MGELLYKVGDYLLGSALHRILTGAGLTLGTSAVSVVVLDNLIQKTRQHLNGISDLGMAMIDLSGTDTAISLIISAIMTRMAIDKATIFLKADE